MSMMSNKMMPSACETDITGLASMYALQLASGEPAAIVDLNNNYGDDPDKCVLFHCGNWPLNFYTDAQMATAEVLGTTLGEENVWGAIAGRAPTAPLTIARISTDDVNGMCKAYVAEGRFLDDPLETFGSKAVVEIPDFQPLLRHICKVGFEHHCAMSPSHTADAVAEALGTYLKWEVYRHE
jgi:L-fucose isomerase-like protein